MTFSRSDIIVYEIIIYLYLKWLAKSCNILQLSKADLMSDMPMCVIILSLGTGEKFIFLIWYTFVLYHVLIKHETKKKVAAILQTYMKMFLNENIWFSFKFYRSMFPGSSLQYDSNSYANGLFPVQCQWWLVYWRTNASLGIIESRSNERHDE